MPLRSTRRTAQLPASIDGGPGSDSLAGGEGDDTICGDDQSPDCLEGGGGDEPSTAWVTRRLRPWRRHQSARQLRIPQLAPRYRTNDARWATRSRVTVGGC